jgi:uncharacterized protein YhfF
MRAGVINKGFPRINVLRSIEFGTPGAMRDRLNDLIINYQKQIGIIKVTKVEASEFKDMPTEYALAEAEGDLSGDDFRQIHLKF